MLKKILIQPISTLKNYKNNGEIPGLFQEINTIMHGIVITTM